LDLHSQLATFFSQPRYRNVVTIYGLVNEPKMIALPTQAVLDWTTQAISLVRKNGFNNTIVFGDGFLGLPNWQGKLQGISNIVMDAHNYVIFNNAQIAFSHQVKLNYACSGWQGQMRMSINTASG
jgi:glucan 1,3-beta-glucosidase